jgi:Do/DeqQ family serine protease
MNELKRNLLKFLRENPFPVLTSMWLAIVAVGLFGVALFLPHNSQISGLTTASAEEPLVPRAAATSYADVVERTAPAVVTIRSERRGKMQQQGAPQMNDPLQEFFGGRVPNQRQQRPNTQRAMGSGVIVEANGTILTNNHVVAGADRVRVEMTDKRTFDAKVVGTDEASDLAVLKVEAANLPVLPLGDSDRVRVGDVVLAIGNPLGLEQTVTSGIISAKGRSTGLSDGSFEDFLQTDAPINQGNSGGALISAGGELIGINSQILSPTGGNIGIGFSIPSNMARSVMLQLIKDGKVHRGMLGVGIQNITSELAANFGLKDVRGVLINSVAKNGAADRAGLRQGDVIVGFNNAPIVDGNALRNKVAQTAPGSEINLTVAREGTEQNFKVKLGEFQAVNSGETTEKNPSSGAPSTGGKLGVELQNLTPETARRLNLNGAVSGVIVADVEAGSPAEDAGLSPGDVILQVNRKNVNSVAEVGTALEVSNGKSVLLYINRRGQSLFLTVRQ